MTYTQVSLASFTSSEANRNSPFICVEAPFEGSFVIDDPYTGRFHFGTRDKRLENKYYLFPPLQKINNGRRLLKLLWLPYRKSLLDKIIESQQEAYLCYSERHHGIEDKPLLWSTAHIAIPVRINKNKTLQDKSAWEVDHFFDVPTFAF